MAASMRRPPVSFTLPIACQICLGKVKQPVICKNQHVFCNSCLEVWLQHSSHCPTCRIPITPESPCKQILGGPSCSDDSERSKSTPELRKTRFELLYREYEDEIEHLQSEVGILRARNVELESSRVPTSQSISPKEPSSETHDAAESSLIKSPLKDRSMHEKGSAAHSSKRDSVDSLLELTQKLKSATCAYEKLRSDLDKMKQDNVQLRNTNVNYLREIGRLKHDLSSRSPRKYEKYALAAQQTKLDKSEQEVKQLKRALERSDVYMEELEYKLEKYRQKYGELDLDASKPNLEKCFNDESSEFKCLDKFVRKGAQHSVLVEDSDGRNKYRSVVQDGGEKDYEPVHKKVHVVKQCNLLTFSSIAGNDNEAYGRTETNVNVKKTDIDRSSVGPVYFQGDGFQCSVSRNFLPRRKTPVTPSSAFAKLKVSSTSKTGRPGTSQDGTAPQQSSSSRWLDDSDRYEQTSRRQLNFDLKKCADNQENFSSRDVESPGDKDANQGGPEDIQNQTLSDLNFSLTPEFVDCANLMKAAEKRIRQRNGDDVNTALSNDPSPAASGLMKDEPQQSTSSDS